MYVCMYVVCMCVCMYVCMYIVCMYVRACVCVLTGNVVHHHCHCGVPNVRGNETAEALLSRCVPQLKTNLQQEGAGRRGSSE